MSQKLVAVVVLSLAVTACAKGSNETTFSAPGRTEVKAGVGHQMDGWGKKGNRDVRTQAGKLR